MKVAFHKSVVVLVLAACGLVIIVGGWILLRDTEPLPAEPTGDQWHSVNAPIGPNSTLDAQIDRPSPVEGISGRWRAANISKPAGSEFDAQVEKLSTLGYLQGYNPPPEDRGVTVHDPQRAYDGINLYTSGHAPEAVIMDMAGNVLHRWTYEIEKALPDIPDLPGNQNWQERKSHWRRVHLYPNGDILALYDMICLLKLSRDSQLLWTFKVPYPHHHMQVSGDGRIFVLTKRIWERPEINPDDQVFEDYITVLDSNGKFITTFSLLESFRRSSYAFILDYMPRKGDLFHANTIHILDGRHADISPVYRKGNLLIAALYVNTMAIVDPQEQRVVWALRGDEDRLWSGLHEPMLLDNANILVFDNNWTQDTNSRIIEFNPLTKQIAWMYQGTAQQPFFSRFCGTSQRLANGNTLITESENGRAFEVTPEGDIVWQYVTPHRAGKNNELIATLLHLNRIDRSDVNWLVTDPPDGGR